MWYGKRQYLSGHTIARRNCNFGYRTVKLHSTIQKTHQAPIHGSIKETTQSKIRNVHRQFLFTDKKIFTVEESFNKQNVRAYALSSRDAAELRELREVSIRLL